MKESIIFGNKANFAIEISPTKIKKKFYLRLWFKGLHMGNFERADYLDDSYKQYKKIVEKKEKMYLPIFDNMNIEDIFKHVFHLDFSKDEDVAKYDELTDQGIRGHFGYQFSDTKSAQILLCIKDDLWVIWQNDFGDPILNAKIDFQYFSQIFEDYIKFCIVNNFFSS